MSKYDGVKFLSYKGREYKIKNDKFRIASWDYFGSHYYILIVPQLPNGEKAAIRISYYTENPLILFETFTKKTAGSTKSFAKPENCIKVEDVPENFRFIVEDAIEYLRERVYLEKPLEHIKQELAHIKGHPLRKLFKSKRHTKLSYIVNMENKLIYAWSFDEPVVAVFEFENTPAKANPIPKVLLRGKNYVLEYLEDYDFIEGYVYTLYRDEKLFRVTGKEIYKQERSI